MALSITKVGALNSVGDRYQQAAVLGLGIYAAGGVGPIAARDFGLSTIEWVQITSPPSATLWTGAIMVEYDRANKMFKVFDVDASPPTELPAGANLTDVNLQVVIQGK